MEKTLDDIVEELAQMVDTQIEKDLQNGNIKIECGSSQSETQI